MSASKRRTIVFEKSGVIDRIVNNVYSKTESEEISEKAKTILSKCAGKSSKNFKIRIFGKDIDISYEPKPQKNKYMPIADANDKIVHIYQAITKDNEEEMHYVLLHELTHTLQIIKTKERIAEYSKTPTNQMWERISYMLSINVDNALYFKRTSPEGMLSYLIYRLHKHEEYAWSNNMYIDAVREQEKRIINYMDTNPKTTLDEVMRANFISIQTYNDIVSKIKEGSGILDEMIISDLISFFNEISRSKIAYLHFDKSVFQIPEVKKMRKTVAKIIDSNMSEENTVYALADIATKYTKILQKTPEVLDKIKASFIERMNRRFKSVYQRFTKAILLGIEDANSVYRAID